MNPLGLPLQLDQTYVLHPETTGSPNGAFRRDDLAWRGDTLQPRRCVHCVTGHHGDPLLKNKDVGYLIETVRLVAEGRIVIDPDLAPALTEGLTQGRGGVKPTRAPTLTARELEILQLLAFGNTNKEIAEKLGISPETVKAHLEHVFEKLEVSDRAAAVAKAFRRGLVE